MHTLIDSCLFFTYDITILLIDIKISHLTVSLNMDWYTCFETYWCIINLLHSYVNIKEYSTLKYEKNRHILKHGKQAHPFTCFLMWNMLNASWKSQFSQYLLIISSFENIFLDNENKNREKYSARYICVHVTTRIFIISIFFILFKYS